MIELQQVGKTYRGGSPLRREPVQALDGVTLSVRSGESIAIVGLNGAGKSTLLRILMGYARPTSGMASIGGLTPRSYAEAHGIAYIPERVTIPRQWTVEGALRALAMFGGVGEAAWERVREAIERLGLRSLADRKVAALSKGNLQRLAIAQALLADRKLMVLDEPTDGLDPVWIVELRSIISEWRGADPERVVVLASHNLAEVERLADRVILLHNGAVRGEVSLGEPAGSLEADFLQRIAGFEEGRA